MNTPFVVRVARGGFSIIAALATLGVPRANAADAPRRPNVLFILTEDQGAQLGFLGTPGLRTPAMDSIARSGVYFDQAFVAYPVCSASKSCIYTGVHSHANGVINNTLNYHKPASELTAAEKAQPLYRNNHVRAELPTLVERLHAAGYYQGVTSKLHVLPNDKFPYDEFIGKVGNQVVADFIQRAKQTGKPWHLFYNIPQSHRPYPNSDQKRIRVNPNEVKLPAFLPDTPVVRKDWAEYLAAIEEADQRVGDGLAALRAAGEENNTIIVFLGDHGPSFQHGKMTVYDLGLRTPLIIHVPWLQGGFRTPALASEVDLTPTLLDLLGLEPLPSAQGVSLKPVLADRTSAGPRAFVFAEISDRGQFPNDGMQERSVFDGRWHLIYREKVTPPWRLVQDDNKYWKLWRNRTYDETVRVKDQFPEQYRILAEMDPQTLHASVPTLELYDLRSDPDEMRNRAADANCRAELEQLMVALRTWVRETGDPAVKP